jgi:hypothetical protein
MINALIHNATGSVLEWGTVEYVPAAGQSVVQVFDASTFPEGEPNIYVKVLGGFFMAMNALERRAVNLAIPQRRPQRVLHEDEELVTTNETSPGGGWGDFIPLVTAEPLLAGPYQVVCGFELALLANSAVHTAQARLRIDGVEVATWQNPRSPYNRCQFIDTIAFPHGATPTFSVQIRRFGAAPGTARARRGSVLIYPAPPIAVEL